ncbi:hypothetical protein EW146_g3058 [Bondarzewia mesenterica]|uniref:Uncharacterized protein n=1 Tax=Bondarzewia mesenterica TaxID=1095465 RepID=A0A4S4M0M1_9AGAM|nr:hypothetical protein EW146_g3058 [Bondarzewia mesenterica]
MAFFSAPEQEILTHRLARNSSVDRLHNRYAKPSTSVTLHAPTKSAHAKHSSDGHDDDRADRHHTNTARAPTAPSPRSMQSGVTQVLGSLEPIHSDGSMPSAASISNKPSTPGTSKRKPPPSMTQDERSPETSTERYRYPPVSTSAPPPQGHTNATPFPSKPNEFGQMPLVQSPSSMSSSPLSSSVRTTPFSSASSSRSGSTSDSGSKQRSVPRIPEHPSPSTTHSQTLLSPLDARQHMPSSPARMTSGNTSDGGTNSDRASSPLVASHLDVKRLLSKPAAPSRPSTISIPSDADTVPGSLAWMRSSTLPPLRDSASRSRSGDNVDSRQVVSREVRHEKSRSAGNPTHPHHGSLAVTLSGGAEQSKPLHSSSSRDLSIIKDAHNSLYAKDRPRNILHKRSFKGLMSPASPVTPAMPALSPRPGSSAPSTPRPATSPLANPDRSQHAALSIPKPKSSSHSSPQRSPSPKLTPAGAIVQAYKEQGVRREKLEAHAHGQESRSSQEAQGEHRHNKPASPPPFQSYGQSAGMGAEAAGEEQSKGPYYTVFGSTSGRVVALGSAEDIAWNEDNVRAMSTITTRASVSAGTTPIKQSLSRKVSLRFRKIRADSPQRTTVVVAGEGSRPSLQERRSATLPRERRKSLRLSIDDYVDVQVPELTTSYSARSMVSNRVIDAKEDGSPASSVRSRQAKGKEREKKEDDSPPAGKLWRLMKRISTGGLRDRYNSAGSSPPPVPALPKDMKPHPTSRTTFELHTPTPYRREFGAMDRFLESRASLSGMRPSTAPHHVVGMPGSTTPTKRPSTAQSKVGSGSAGRPSTTTRSSSPQSTSDKASSKFFRVHSARSSSSSYGEELPPLPKMGQHIIPPNELQRWDRDEDSLVQARVPLSAPNPVDSFGDAKPSLPYPRRRALANLPPSPDIPTFSTTEPVNYFPTHRSTSSRQDERPSLSIVPPASQPLPRAEFGLESSASATPFPPPRPTRSARRPHTANSILSTPTPSTSTTTTSTSTTSSPNTPPLTYISEFNGPEFDVGCRNRDSTGGHSTASTAKARPQSPPASATVTNLTFRELDSSPRQAWTEQEKARKWDDLLERSARAGGTLHLGDSGLASDNIRFSTYSEI